MLFKEKFIFFIDNRKKSSMLSNTFNITKFKKNNRDGLFNKLKNWGYAFHKLNYKKDRSIKINKFLNEGLLGWTHSAELRDGKKIELFLFADKVQLKIDNIIIKEILDWESDMMKTFRQISNEYEKYFYTKEEIISYYKDRDDINDIETLLNSFYPDLKVRKINKEKNHFSVIIGSSVVTYLIEKKKCEHKKITIHSYFLSKNKHMYSTSKYSLPIKYRRHLKTYHNYALYSLSLKTLKNIQNKLKYVK